MKNFFCRSLCCLCLLMAPVSFAVPDRLTTGFGASVTVTSQPDVSVVSGVFAMKETQNYLAYLPVLRDVREDTVWIVKNNPAENDAAVGDVGASGLLRRLSPAICKGLDMAVVAGTSRGCTKSVSVNVSGGMLSSAGYMSYSLSHPKKASLTFYSAHSKLSGQGYVLFGDIEMFAVKNGSANAWINSFEGNVLYKSSGRASDKFMDESGNIAAYVRSFDNLGVVFYSVSSYRGTGLSFSLGGPGTRFVLPHKKSGRYFGSVTVHLNMQGHSAI